MAYGRNGDVLLFALSLGILMGVFERAPESVTGGAVRKTMSWIGGKGWVDPVPGADEARSSPPSVNSDVSSSDGWTSDGQEGSVLLEDLGSSNVSSGEDIGHGVKILDENVMNSPGRM